MRSECRYQIHWPLSWPAVIAASRIDKYDGDFVTFHYNRHEDDAYAEETIPVMDFIARLIPHIPEKHFKMIRYGGLYARNREIDKNPHHAISREKHHVYRSFNQWRAAIFPAFSNDPLKCESGISYKFKKTSQYKELFTVLCISSF